MCVVSENIPVGATACDLVGQLAGKKILTGDIPTKNTTTVQTPYVILAELDASGNFCNFRVATECQGFKANVKPVRVANTSVFNLPNGSTAINAMGILATKTVACPVMLMIHGRAAVNGSLDTNDVYVLHYRINGGSWVGLHRTGVMGGTGTRQSDMNGDDIVSLPAGTYTVELGIQKALLGNATGGGAFASLMIEEYYS